MKRTLFAGLLLAVLAAAAALIGNALGLTLGNTLFGAAIGAVLGLVAYSSPGWRAGAFVVGLVITWIFYAIRAAVLPATSVSTAIAAFFVILIVTGISLATKRKMHLWAMLLGVVAMTGAYEAPFNAAPYLFITQSVSTVGAIFVAVAFGWIAVVLADFISGGELEDEEPVSAPAVANTSTGLPLVQSGGNKE